MTQHKRQSVVLIVDDSPTSRAVLSDALTESDFQVNVAHDGESALKQINKQLPDLILLDVMMPGLDGFDTCMKLKENPITSDIPVIFMTALSDSVDKVKGLQLGAVDYIIKPLQKEEVLARVRVHIKLYNLTRTLEQRVEERTAELSQALRDLQQAQVQLIQSEKMSSLGQLLAGIAHEINNPVNFIYGNVDYAVEYINDLFKLINLYQEKYEPTPEIASLTETIELEFLKKDLPKLLSSMQVGTERIQEIVRSLRNFSRLDESDKQPVDLHEGLDTTLMILGNRLKSQSNRLEIKIIKNYGDLPPVNCYSGQINQVFMNILSNSIDALEELRNNAESEEFSSLFSRENSKAKSKIPTIRIVTEVVNVNAIQVRIADNGTGITQEVKKRLFEPFFTTKPLGKGTGMGMSISYQIVTKKHGGKIKCLSSPGQGTEFIIEIPK